MVQHRGLPVLALPPRGQRKRVLLSILGIEAVAAFLLIFIHTQISQSAAKWLLAMSSTAFEGSNESILFQLVGVTFASYHAELIAFLAILSLRTILVLRVLTTDVLSDKLWPLKLIGWKNVGWFVGTVCLYYLLLWLGLVVLIIPAVLFLYLFFSWPILYISGGSIGFSSLWSSLSATASQWKKLFLPWLLSLAAQVAFLVGVWNSMFSFEQTSPFYGIPLLFLCLSGAELGYLMWLKYFTRTVQKMPSPAIPRWVMGVGLAGLLLTSSWLFIQAKSLGALNQDPTLRSQLIYDLLPKAETSILINWQKQLEGLRAQEEMTPEQSERLDDLINQMSIEYKNQATMSGSIQLNEGDVVPSED